MAASASRVVVRVGDKVRPIRDIQFHVPIKGALAGPRFREDWLRSTYEYKVHLVSRDGSWIQIEERSIKAQPIFYTRDFEVVVEEPQRVLQLA